MNRTLLEKVQRMLSNARLGKGFWAKAMTYACHLINRLSSTAIIYRIPLEVWSKQLVSDYDFLHVFGSTTYYHVKESKLDPRAKKAIFLGFFSRIKGYHLWCPSSKKIVSSRDVTFDESSILKILENRTKANGISQPVEHSQQQVEFEITLHPTRSVETDVSNTIIEEDLRYGGEGSAKESQ